MHSRIRVLLPVTAVAVLAVVAGRAALGGTASATATARPIEAGVVVIETNLGLQGGRAAGTGMVLTRAGEVVTNNHVIAGATSIRVIVPESGRIATATVAGYDVSADVAVLRLSGAARHSTVSLGHSSALRVGQLVRAVGNARGAGRLTLVRGQVTGLGRSITVATDEGGSMRLGGLIETSASLQPGDSGGPLFDTSGRVVGMDAAASNGTTAAYDSLVDSYAIPIDRVRRIVRQIDARRSSATVHVGRTAFLGVQVASPGAAGAGSRGAVVGGIVPGSPVARTPLGFGDTIVALGGRPVRNSGGLVSVLLRHHPGDRVTVKWLDGSGLAHRTTVTLAEGPPQ